MGVGAGEPLPELLLQPVAASSMVRAMTARTGASLPEIRWRSPTMRHPNMANIIPAMGNNGALTGSVDATKFGATVRVRVLLFALVPLSTKEDGLNEQEIPGGNAPQENVTVSKEIGFGVAVITNCAVWPGVRLASVGVADNVYRDRGASMVWIRVACVWPT